MIFIHDSEPVSGNPAAKWCYACGRQMETTEFRNNGTRKDGLDNMCVWCRNQYMRLYMRAYRKRLQQERQV